MSTRTCSIKECNEPLYAKTYCKPHWRRVWKTGEVKQDKPIRKQVRGRVGCLVEGCAKAHRSMGLCAAHSSAARAYKLDSSVYAQMIISPCVICRSSERPVIDHDHACCPGKTSCGECVRGTLCMNCNNALGLAGEDIEMLRAGAAYLLRTGAK